MTNIRDCTYHFFFGCHRLVDQRDNSTRARILGEVTIYRRYRIGIRCLRYYCNFHENMDPGLLVTVTNIITPFVHHTLLSQIECFS